MHEEDAGDEQVVLDGDHDASRRDWLPRRCAFATRSCLAPGLGRLPAARDGDRADDRDHEERAS